MMVTVDPATTQKTVTAILLVLPTVIAVITTKSYAPTPVILLHCLSSVNLNELPGT